MARFITDNQFDTEVEFIPGRYADDLPVILLFASGAVCFAAMISFILDGWQNAVFLLLLAIWLELFYICVEKR